MGADALASPLTTVALPAALGLIMFGLGLSLTPADFARVGRRPRAAGIALACQLLVLPVMGFGLALLFRLSPETAVGLMLLAASPGGTAANLYSHLFRGDVALNISLTAINSILAVLTLPIVVNLSVAWYQPGEFSVGLRFSKTVEVFMVVLGPVALGMLVRRLRPSFADAMDRPVRVVSVAFLTLLIGAAVAANLATLKDEVVGLAGVTVAFCLLSLTVGFVVPRLLSVARDQAIASAFEVGLHNAALAIVVAQSVLQRPEMSLPAAVYGVLMFPLAAVFGAVLTRTAPREAARAVT
ncbi:bile acid:sodium symporter family protein [Caulobacter radicis]|uniref:Bile acid:sodium symporter n=1 Tax=Caulobacter radicis TaxID=2172650 RepID=A0A2T9JVP4_9CAUL|nr:bile acid:sodium symporter family protein [Caulobacter radicis]PVM87793.1 bile acid:sodium symporter [Caulobacter radicis]